MVRPGQQDGGELIDQRLAAAGRHYDQRILAGENGVDRLPLAGPEILMAKALGEQLTGCFLALSVSTHWL